MEIKLQAALKYSRDRTSALAELQKNWFNGITNQQAYSGYK